MSHRSRPCLKHQLGLCAAPCVGLHRRGAYGEHVERAAATCSAGTSPTSSATSSTHANAAGAQEYELAAASATASRRCGVPSSARACFGARTERDVLGLARSGERLLVHRLCIRRGKLAESRTYAFQSELPDEECLHSVLTSLYAADGRAPPREIVLPVQPVERALLEAVLPGCELVVPRAASARGSSPWRARTRCWSSRAREHEREDRSTAEAALARLCAARTARRPARRRRLRRLQLPGRERRRQPRALPRRPPDRAGYGASACAACRARTTSRSMREVVGRSLRRGMEEGDLPTSC
jgi:excinuclease UvrABC nuclease subunit